jgi:sporulation protein YlmC with PRC-barrel domain
MSRQVRVQELVGRAVRDADGKVVGRIMEITAHWRGDECYVDEFEVGTRALLERLGIGGKREPRKVPWQELDLSDPERPALRPSPPRNSRG